jgi:uncharacterized metal-binding protein YceD (DUF177 family)
VEKEMRQYDIHFVGLGAGEHIFEYKIEDSFWGLFPESQIQKGKCAVVLTFDKEASHFVLNFNIQGNIIVDCDRCTAEINYPVFNNFTLYVKFDDERNTGTSEDNDEVIYISRGESAINVAQYIYEYISLSIPMVRNCDFLEEQFKNCNQEVLKKLNNEEQNNNIDDRWAALKKLK